MRVFFLFSLLNIFCVCLKAQNNIYVYFSNNEIIEYHSKGKGILYSFDSILLQKEGDERYYYPEEIDSIRTNYILLQSKNVKRNKENKKEFIEPIVTGEMSLYQSKKINGDLCIYLQKKDSTIYYISEKYYRNYITSLFSDCERLGVIKQPEYMDNFRYDLSSFSELVLKYNNCINRDSKTIIHKDPKLKFNKFITLGATTSVLKPEHKPYYGQKFSLYLSPYMGAAIGHFYLDRFGYNIGLNYSKVQSTSIFTSKGVRMDDNNKLIVVDVDVDIDISYHLIELPLGFCLKPYNFKNVTPYIEIGPMFDIIFLNNSKVIADDNYKEVVDYKYDIKFEEINIGMFMNLGLEITKFDRRFNVNFGISNIKDSFSPITSYSYYNYKSTISITKFLFSVRMFI